VLHHIQLTVHCLPYIRLPKMTNQYIFALKMATAVSAKILYDLAFAARRPRFFKNCKAME
jgi:hypothetical protein